MSPAIAHAVTIQTSSTGFTAAVGAGSIRTTSTLGTLFGQISTVALANGVSITLSGTADTVDQPGVG
ncbi:MAG: hypothetical protein ACRYG8_43290, partial [Janthinobacterium lividum]